MFDLPDNYVYNYKNKYLVYVYHRFYTYYYNQYIDILKDEPDLMDNLAYKHTYNRMNPSLHHYNKLCCNHHNYNNSFRLLSSHYNNIEFVHLMNNDPNNTLHLYFHNLYNIG